MEKSENKISKNIGNHYRTSHLFDFKILLKINFSFIHIYISYADIAWAGTFNIAWTSTPGNCREIKTSCTDNFSYKQIRPFRTIIKRK